VNRFNPVRRFTSPDDRSVVATGFLIPNPIDRYVINDRTDLRYNAVVAICSDGLREWLSGPRRAARRAAGGDWYLAGAI
jgi:hypothetical protein